MIRVDSRKVQKGDIFVAIRGFAVDGHEYAKAAEMAGAVRIVCEHKIDGVTIPQEIVENSRVAAGELAAEFFGHPSESFKLIGVTGTNGKTTTTYMIKSILEANGHKVGLIGTNQNMIGERVLRTERTTPESVDLQELFAQMRDSGCEYVVMEVSSHALHLERVAGSRFVVGAFTNLSQDHLDFHANMEEYFSAKERLFDMAEKAVINVDDEWGRRLAENHDCMRVSGSDITFNLPKTIVGDFNLHNAAVALGVCKALNFTEQQIEEGFAGFKGVCGRMEVVTDGQPFDVIIDYAHTPDGLKNVLETVRGFAKGRVVVVFGCGGDRDAAKRPIMGNIASKLADFCIVTSDNPRTEDPSAIIEQILSGMDSCEKSVIIDRREAINYAIETAQKDDTIILAGKGHEDYQILGVEKIHFDEHEIVKEILNV